MEPVLSALRVSLLNVNMEEDILYPHLESSGLMGPVWLLNLPMDFTTSRS